MAELIAFVVLACAVAVICFCVGVDDDGDLL